MRIKSGIDKVDKVMGEYYDWMENGPEGFAYDRVLFLLKSLRFNSKYIEYYSFYPDSYNPLGVEIKTNLNQFGKRKLIKINMDYIANKPIREMMLANEIIKELNDSFIN